MILIAFPLLVTVNGLSTIFIHSPVAEELVSSALGNEFVSTELNLQKQEADRFTNDFGMTFVAISPGRFQMGSPLNELGRIFIFEKQNEVEIEKEFYLQTTETTQEQWEQVMGSNPSYFFNCGKDCPVENVSWFNVQDFIQKLNRNDTENRYRLPTETEWEFACRSGSTTAFSNSGLFELGCKADSKLDELAWYSCNSNGKTHPVGHKMPNRYGLYDMHGNVYEWCQDMFKPDYSDTPDGKYNEKDPAGDRSIRSCSWDDTKVNCRSASRNNIGPGRKTNTIGFRLVRESRYYKINMQAPIQNDREIIEESAQTTTTESTQPKPAIQEDSDEDSQFAVQVASTKSLDYAESRVAYFTEQGYDAYYVKVRIADMGIWYRICLGNFSSELDTEAFRKELAKQNIQGIILKKQAFQ